MLSWAAALLILLLHRVAEGYRPVIVMHGIASTYMSMEDLVAFIRDAHPGTKVYNVDAFNDLDSFENMWTQVHTVQKIVGPIIANATDGINLVCFSQGGLLCRALLQVYPNHNVKTFISLSGPQAGQFGDTAYFHFFFPNFTKDNLYLICYTDVGQDVSFCDYWNDPHHQSEFQGGSSFLYPLDNSYTPDYKNNFELLEHLVLIGGPDDGVITPWQSSHFAFYDQNMIIQPYQKQEFYASDAFGLKTLDQENRIHVYEISGVQHIHWHGNKTVFDCCIEPWLT